MSQFGPIPEEIVERKTIVFKSRIDPRSVRATAEKMKTTLFKKLFFMKPKPEEVQIISIDKYFEPFVVAEGEYRIDYSKKWSRNIQVDETMKSLTIFNGKIEPLSLKDHLKSATKIVTVTGEGRYNFVEKAHLLFDGNWNEVGLDQLPFVPFEEQPEKVLSNVNRQFDEDDFNAGKEVSFLRSKIADRPTDITSIHDELFTVSDRALIYKPMYAVTIHNIKTNKKATLTIDAVTGKTKSHIHKKKDSKQKKSTKKPVKTDSAKTNEPRESKIVKKQKNRQIK